MHIIIIIIINNNNSIIIIIIYNFLFYLKRVVSDYNKVVCRASCTAEDSWKGMFIAS